MGFAVGHRFRLVQRGGRALIVRDARSLRTGQKQLEGRNVRHAGEHAIAMESGEDAYPLVSHTRQRTSKTYLCGTVTTELVRRLRTLCATQ
jgi:hypothetical protein